VLSKNEETQLRKALSRTFLNGFPNPDRRGCPGSDILKVIASGKLTLEEAEPWIHHFSSCSPCTREFSEFRKAFQRRRVQRFAAIAAAILLVVSVLTWVFLRRSFEPARFEAASLDLTGRGVIRGPEENPQNPCNSRTVTWISLFTCHSEANLELMTSRSSGSQGSLYGVRKEKLEL